MTKCAGCISCACRMRMKSRTAMRWRTHARTRPRVRQLTSVAVGMRNVGQDIVNASRGNKSDFEVAREIIGGGNGRKASNAEIASVILSGPAD